MTIRNFIISESLSADDLLFSLNNKLNNLKKEMDNIDIALNSLIKTRKHITKQIGEIESTISKLERSL